MREVRGADQIAAGVMVAAQAEHTVVAAPDVATSIVAHLAAQLRALGERTKELKTRIIATWRSHPRAAIIESAWDD